ncbi:MAG TPA: hypothetical protein VF911_14250, partial [Thermoanaerobaculia bacterium]
SHEKAALEWTPEGLLTGDPVSKDRLRSLLRGAVRWYAAAAVLMIAVVLPAGLFFFAQRPVEAAQLAWRTPWSLIVFASAVILLLSPLQAILEGCGLVADVAMMRFLQSVIGSGTLWLCLCLGFRLYAAAALYLSISAWIAAWLWWKKRAPLLDLVSGVTGGAAIAWRTEVWPLQWKVAASWLSGYLIFQLFNPVLFAFHGPVAAGQMGMSLSLTGALGAVGMAWISTKAPSFGVLIRQKAYDRLDALFFPSLYQSTVVVCLGAAAVTILVWSLSEFHHPWASRVIAPLPFGCFALATILNHVVFAEAVYLRAHKEEPLLGTSVLFACCYTVSTLVLGRKYGASGMAFGYLAITVVGTGVITRIFMRNRRVWHAPASRAASPEGLMTHATPDDRNPDVRP